jgi:signal transduction histidine kinase
MAIVLSGVGVFVYERVGNGLLASVDQTLASQSKDELSHEHIDTDAAGGTTLAQVMASNGRILRSEPQNLPRLLGPALFSAALSRGRVVQTAGIAGRAGAWRLLAVRDPTNGSVAVVARSLEPRAVSLDHLQHELVIFLSLALIAASLGGYALAAFALRPVEALRKQAETVTPGEPGGLPVPAARDEISRLALTLNDMLERLQAAVEHERRFVADASHELRTPLALLRTELELALRRPRSSDELTDALRSAAEETERLSRLAEDLLLLARADQGTLPMRLEVVHAGELLTEVAARFAIRVDSLQRRIDVDLGDVGADIEVDPVRVEQALTNLVDNALIYAEGAVELSCKVSGDTVELHVRDEGDGFPREFRARAFDRFSRADEARSNGGAGLGLSIVEFVARAHGGSVGLGDAPGRGADVWIALPRAV